MIMIENIIIITIVITIGLLLIILGTYLKKVINNFKKNGVETDFEVLNVETKSQYDNNNNKIGEFYLTTFKFKYNDKVLKETIQTRHKFKVGITISGKYLPTAKLNKISVAGEGFSIPNNIPKLLIFLGSIIISIPILILLNIPIKIVTFIILIEFLIFILISRLTMKK